MQPATRVETAVHQRLPKYAYDKATSSNIGMAAADLDQPGRHSSAQAQVGVGRVRISEEDHGTCDMG